MRRLSVAFALLLCSGLLLALVGPRPPRLLAPDSPAPSPAVGSVVEPAGLWSSAAGRELVVARAWGLVGRWPGASVPLAVGSVVEPAGLWSSAAGRELARARALDLADRPWLGVPVRVAAAPVAGGGYRWPLDGLPPVVRRFDPPAERWLAGHRGVDLAAAPGAVVRAAGPGQVRFAGPIGGRSVVSIDHAGGLRTTYEPLSPSVRAGDRVDAGDPIGQLTAGHPGCPITACLHWGLRRGDLYLDPLALLGLGQVRLLPLRD